MSCNCLAILREMWTRRFPSRSWKLRERNYEEIFSFFAADRASLSAVFSPRVFRRAHFTAGVTRILLRTFAQGCHISKYQTETDWDKEPREQMFCRCLATLAWFLAQLEAMKKESRERKFQQDFKLLVSAAVVRQNSEVKVASKVEERRAPLS